MNVWTIDSKFVSLWLLMQSLAWPAGLISGTWIGWWWLDWLVEHVPGKPQLTYGIWPSHAYLGLFLCTSLCLGGALVGVSVGITQWLLLRRRYPMTLRWIWANVAIWSCSGALLGLIVLFSGINTLYSLLVFVAGGLVTCYWLEQSLMKFYRTTGQLLPLDAPPPMQNRFVLYRMVFLGNGLGLVTSFIAAGVMLGV